jgi:hypothetical protein
MLDGFQGRMGILEEYINGRGNMGKFSGRKRPRESGRMEMDAKDNARLSGTVTFVKAGTGRG